MYTPYSLTFYIQLTKRNLRGRKPQVLTPSIINSHGLMEDPGCRFVRLDSIGF